MEKEDCNKRKKKKREQEEEEYNEHEEASLKMASKSQVGERGKGRRHGRNNWASGSLEVWRCAERKKDPKWSK